MNNEFLTFQRFNDSALAVEIATRLKENNIDYLLEDNTKIFDPSFANNSFESDIILKIKAADFSNARQTLNEYYKTLVSNVDKDYYLFEFTNEELTEIVAKPDEWGYFDYELAQKILANRGYEIKPEIATQLKTERIKELAKPENVKKNLIYLGYTTAILGGLGGLAIGWMLANLKKTLPDGKRVYAYGERERIHGNRILVISTISIGLWYYDLFKR